MDELHDGWIIKRIIDKWSLPFNARWKITAAHERECIVNFTGLESGNKSAARENNRNCQDIEPSNASRFRGSL